MKKGEFINGLTTPYGLRAAKPPASLIPLNVGVEDELSTCVGNSKHGVLSSKAMKFCVSAFRRRILASPKIEHILDLLPDLTISLDGTNTYLALLGWDRLRFRRCQLVFNCPIDSMSLRLEEQRLHGQKP